MFVNPRAPITRAAFRGNVGPTKCSTVGLSRRLRPASRRCSEFTSNHLRMKRTALTALVVTAMAACTSEKPPQQVVGEALIREGQRQMEPVQKALNQSLTDWGEKLAQDEAERKERLRRARQGEPIRSCVIDGVKTFENRGNLCPPESEH